MIAFLKGRCILREDSRIVLDVQGVGYEVFAPNRAIEAWSTAEQLIDIYISTQVREDSLTLYGFPTLVERKAFLTLLSVTGIGPKLALACIDALSINNLVKAIETEDIVALSRIPGVGKKTAQRLALEVKGKLEMDFQPTSEARTPVLREDDSFQAALTRLGYQRSEIVQVREALRRENVPEDAPLADRLRAALRVLYRPDSDRGPR